MSTSVSIRGGETNDDFKEEAFADRENELRRVEQLVESARVGRVDRTLVEISGPVGQGKTWLLKNLCGRYSADKSETTVSAYVDLQGFASTDRFVALLQDLINQIKKQLEGKTALTFLLNDTAEPKQVAADFVKLLGKLIEDEDNERVPVLIFDTTEAVKRDEKRSRKKRIASLLDWLEEDIVYPLMRTNQAVLVFGGRHGLQWKKFEVRRRVEPLELAEFKLGDTVEQVEKLGAMDAKALAQELYEEYAFGHPLTAAVIYKALDGKSPIGQGQVIREEVLKEVIEGQFLRGRFFEKLAPARVAELKELLWVTCILRRFDYMSLKYFATEFLGDKYKDKAGGFFMDVLRDMQYSTLVRWSSAWGAHIVLPVVRKIMAKNFYMRDPDEFQKRHRIAREKYDAWIDEFPRNAAGFLVERTFHRAWELKAQGKSDGDLLSEFREKIELVSGKYDVQWDLPDIAISLKKELKRDEELAKVAPPGTYDELWREAEKFAERFIEI